MRALRKIVVLSLLLAAMLFVQNASAVVLTTYNLPASSYAASVDNWQGYSLYNQGGFNLHIDFAVYDTEMLDDGDEYDLVTALVEDKGLTGRYIYVYQVLQPTNGSDAEDVGYFDLLRDGETFNGTDVDSIADDFGFISDDWEVGEEPAENINIPVGWRWDASNPLSAGEHSWFLAYSSNFAPVIGSYEIKPPDSRGVPVDGDSPDVPEPITLVLLGSGGAMIFANRRKSVK